MMVINWLLWLLFVYVLCVRLLRWASIWQQKEYRFDRFLAFLRSNEGWTELKRLIIIPYKKTQVRRPKLTKKMIFILVFTILLILNANWETVWGLGALYVFVPVYLIVGTFPALVITWIYLKLTEQQAQQKFQVVQPDVIGVGGSYGKTTTKILVGHLLGQNYSVWVSPKSHNTPLSIAQAISKTYARQDIVVMEYAAYKKGEIGYLIKRYPTKHGVFTGLNLQHLALFGSEANMLQAETELFRSLDESALLFYNDFDRQVVEQVNDLKVKQKIPASQVNLSQTKLNRDGYLTFKMSKGLEVRTQLMGRHYLPNIHQAINVARAYNLSDSQIAKALVNFDPGEEFIHRRLTHNGVVQIVDDRTSNPDGFEAAIELCNHIDAGRKLVISAGIVDLGSEEAQIHHVLAEKIKPVFNYLIHTSALGSENMRAVLDEQYVSLNSLDGLKSWLTEQNLGKGDILLIEGKLHPDMMNYLMSL